MSIEDEAAALRNAPAIQVNNSQYGRCHICGQVENDLQRFDTHIAGLERYACKDCNPERKA